MKLLNYHTILICIINIINMSGFFFTLKGAASLWEVKDTPWNISTAVAGDAGERNLVNQASFCISWGQDQWERRSSLQALLTIDCIKCKLCIWCHCLDPHVTDWHQYYNVVRNIFFGSSRSYSIQSSFLSTLIIFYHNTRQWLYLQDQQQQHPAVNSIQHIHRTCSTWEIGLWPLGLSNQGTQHWQWQEPGLSK